MHIWFPPVFCSRIVPDWITFHHSKSPKKLSFLFVCLFDKTYQTAEQDSPIFISKSEGISGIHASASPAKQGQLNTSRQCFCLKAERVKMGLLLVWEKHWRETDGRPREKSPPPANSERVGSMLLDTALLERPPKPSSGHHTRHPACSLDSDSCGHSSQPGFP